MGFMDGLSELFRGKKPDAQSLGSPQNVQDLNAQLSEQHRLDNLPASLSVNPPFPDPNQKREDQNRRAEITQNLGQEQQATQPVSQINPTPETPNIISTPSIMPTMEAQTPTINSSSEPTILPSTPQETLTPTQPPQEEPKAA